MGNGKMLDMEIDGKCFHFENLFIKNPIRCRFMDVYQIGEICFGPGYRVEDHAQEYYEISYVISGQGLVRIDDTILPVSPGDVVINTMGHIHGIYSDNKNILRFAYLAFLFNEESLHPQYGDLRRYYCGGSFSHYQDRNDILLLFMRCIDELYSETSHSRLMVCNYCEQIVVLCSRKTIQAHAGSAAAADAGNTVYRVIRYIDEHLCAIQSIAQLAEELGYSPVYLSHLFKKRTGMTLQKYISYKKNARALDLLKYGNISISQISEQLNFESPQSFSKAFRRIMGVSPRQYKQQQGSLAAAEATAN